MHEKALIAMSGGVDSSVAAYLTKQAGFECVGATMRLHDATDHTGSDQTDTIEDTADARAVADRLGMPFYVFDLRAQFRKHVVENFIDCYECGLTPNPCIVCNRFLKFEHLPEQARLLGCSLTVTGHYARIRYDAESGRYLLLKAADPSKDQSYVLYSLTQEQLAHTRFPLGEFSKAEVRRIAQEQGFLNARKKDSQDICFIPDGDYMGFMERYNHKKYSAGDFLDLSGKVVGQHKGAVGYTLGQRKGLGLAMGSPVYVCSKNMAQNTVTVGPDEALYRSCLRAKDCNWFPFPALSEPMRVLAKARYRHIEQPATVYPEADGSIRVEFDQPQRAITPGQAVVLYREDTVVGGGTITEVL